MFNFLEISGVQISFRRFLLIIGHLLWMNGTLCFIRSIVNCIVLLAFGTKRIYYTDIISLIFQGYVVDRCPTLRQWRFTSVNFNQNLLVASIFVKRRKLICTPDNKITVQTKFINCLKILQYWGKCSVLF